MGLESLIMQIMIHTTTFYTNQKSKIMHIEKPDPLFGGASGHEEHRPERLEAQTVHARGLPRVVTLVLSKSI